MSVSVIRRRWLKPPRLLGQELQAEEADRARRQPLRLRARLFLLLKIAPPVSLAMIVPGSVWEWVTCSHLR